MKTKIQRSRSLGFTLIELLIVVIIVAILAAIAIPQFSSSTSDAQASALDANLATVRTAIEMYKAQHGGVNPGHTSSTLASGATCTSGTNVSGAVDSLAAMQAQLQYYSNAAGVVCNAPGGDFKYGPYLRQGLPSEPINNKAAATNTVVTFAGTPITASATAGGWAYDTVSGQFIMNSSASDTGNPARAYSAH